MEILVQFFMIALFSFAGEFLSTTFGLPIPGSMIGLILFFTALKTEIIKLERVQTVGNWLKNNLAFFFIPATVSLMGYVDIIRDNLLAIIVTLIASTLITYYITGITSKRILKGGIHNDK